MNSNGNSGANADSLHFAGSATESAPATNAAGGISGRPENSILVSVDKNPGFYARIGRRMLSSRAADKPPCNEVIITGLGTATKTAIGTASMLERENSARVTRVETSYFPSTRSMMKMVPKIAIVCTKTPEFAEQIAREKAAAAAANRASAGVAADGPPGVGGGGAAAGAGAGGSAAVAGMNNSSLAGGLAAASPPDAVAAA